MFATLLFLRFKGSKDIIQQRMNSSAEHHVFLNDIATVSEALASQRFRRLAELSF